MIVIDPMMVLVVGGDEKFNVYGQCSYIEDGKRKVKLVRKWKL